MSEQYTSISLAFKRLFKYLIAANLRLIGWQESWRVTQCVCVCVCVCVVVSFLSIEILNYSSDFILHLYILMYRKLRGIFCSCSGMTSRLKDKLLN